MLLLLLLLLLQLGIMEMCFLTELLEHFGLCMIYWHRRRSLFFRDGCLISKTLDKVVV